MATTGQPSPTAREVIKRRVEGGELLLAGTKPRDVAAKVGVSRQTVYAWKALLAEHGNDLAALRQVDRGGAPARLTAAQKQELEALIDGTSEDIVPAGGWTLRHVSRLIERRFGQPYSLTQVWRLLRDMDYSTHDATAASRVHRRLHVKRPAPTTAMNAAEGPGGANNEASRRDNGDKPNARPDGER